MNIVWAYTAAGVTESLTRASRLVHVLSSDIESYLPYSRVGSFPKVLKSIPSNTNFVEEPSSIDSQSLAALQEEARPSLWTFDGVQYAVERLKRREVKLPDELFANEDTDHHNIVLYDCQSICGAMNSEAKMLLMCRPHKIGVVLNKWAELTTRLTSILMPSSRPRAEKHVAIVIDDVPIPPHAEIHQSIHPSLGAHVRQKYFF